MSSLKVTCTNCEKKYYKGYAFCPHCGQKTDDELTLGLLFYNTISNYFSFDARFIKGFIPLMTKPGFLPEKFIEGKRLIYLHPGQMYLFVAFIFFFVFSFSVRKGTSEIDTTIKKNSVNIDKAFQEEIPIISVSGDSVTAKELSKEDSIKVTKAIALFDNNKEKLGLNDEQIKQIDSAARADMNLSESIDFSFNSEDSKVDSLVKAGADDKTVLKAMGLKENDGFFKRKVYAQMLKLYKERGVGSILQTFYDSLPIALFFMLPIFALILKLFYAKKGPYAHHLVFSLYFFSFLFVAFIILYLINLIISLPVELNFLVMLSTFLYLWLGIKRFYQKSWLTSFLKSGATTFIFIMFVTPATALLVLLFSFLFY